MRLFGCRLKTHKKAAFDKPNHTRSNNKIKNTTKCIKPTDLADKSLATQATVEPCFTTLRSKQRERPGQTVYRVLSHPKCSRFRKQARLHTSAWVPHACVSRPTAPTPLPESTKHRTAKACSKQLNLQSRQQDSYVPPPLSPLPD